MADVICTDVTDPLLLCCCKPSLETPNSYSLCNTLYSWRAPILRCKNPMRADLRVAFIHCNGIVPRVSVIRSMKRLRAPCSPVQLYWRGTAMSLVIRRPTSGELRRGPTKPGGQGGPLSMLVALIMSLMVVL